MGKQERLAKFLYEITAAGIDIGQACVVTGGVFMTDSRFAKLFAKKHGRECVRVDGLVSGWFVKDNPKKPAE